MHRVRIADFGFAAFLGNTGMLQSVIGTPSYMGMYTKNRQKIAPFILLTEITILAPEVVMQHPSRGYGQSVDMWSLGVILYTWYVTRKVFY